MQGEIARARFDVRQVRAVEACAPRQFFLRDAEVVPTLPNRRREARAQFDPGL